VTTNSAAWLRTRFGGPEVGEAPVPTPGDTEVVVRTRAVAVNPIDIIPAVPRWFVLPWLTYPAVIGSDVAGEVVAVGRGVTQVGVGDRVLGHALGVERSRNRPAEGAFQQLTVLQEHMTSRVPDGISFERACVLPLGLSTAACGLFQGDQLGLRLPRADPPREGTVVVWGGSTSVGANAVQLAVNAGYDVVSTASPHNVDMVRRLGAREVVDRRDDRAVDRILAAIDGHELHAVLAIGSGSISRCVDLARRAGGRARVSTTSPAPATVLARRRAQRHGVRLTSIWGGTLADNEVGPAIYNEFLPAALADGRYLPAPDPVVVGTGLEHLPEAFARLRRGVSAAKVVVAL